MKVLVADDSILFRRVVAEALKTLPDVEVVGQVANGKLAVQRVRELKPDLLTLDMEMPEMDGLAVLDALKQSGETTSVIVVSALTKQGGRLTVQALQKGAFDFITKPETSGPGQSIESLRAELAPRVKALSLRLGVRKILRSGTTPAPNTAAAPAPATPVRTTALSDVGARMNRLAFATRPDMVLIGVSTGGPDALGRILPLLPGDLGVPIFIVQHMPPVFTQSLAESLDTRCAMTVKEATHGESALANTIYIAPGGHHMRIVAEASGRPGIQITDDPPENNCRPAVDYLFRSAANNFPGRTTAVILTGMGSDGTLGLRLLKRHGCFVIGQDEASCVVYGMPKAAFDAGVVDVAVPLELIADRIRAAVKGNFT